MSVKFPVSQEKMADIYQGKLNVDSDIYNQVADSLYESVSGIIHKIAIQYSTTCQDEAQDLAHDCVLRIYQKMHLYDSSKSQFTTWVWRVCSNYLAIKYRKSCRYSARFSEEGDFFERSFNDHSVAKSELNQVIGEFVGNNFSPIIDNIFSKNDDGEFDFPKKLNLGKIARESNLTRHEVKKFIENVLKPYMIGKLGEYK